MERYLPQTILGDWGPVGQARLANAKVLVAGAGGLGAVVASYLSAAGVGQIGLVDGDRVAVSNLSRQLVYGTNDIGRLKVEQLSAALLHNNPDTRVIPYPYMLSRDNAEALAESYDIVCDCTDKAEPRIVIDEVCGKLNRPLVYAVVNGWEGYVTVLHHKSGKRLSDLFAATALREAEQQACSVAGIANTVCGVTGSLQATEALRIILQLPGELDGALLALSLQGPVFRVFRLQ
jgi:sulfur-carrier protein adenylyltransferase/sulfurtransferase